MTIINTAIPVPYPVPVDDCSPYGYGGVGGIASPYGYGRLDSALGPYGGPGTPNSDYPYYS